MAIPVDVPRSDEAISIEEFLRRCDRHLDVTDESSIAAMGPSLAALARNRAYFASFFARRLGKINEDGASLFDDAPMNSEQTFTIARRPDYYLRVAVWPIPKDRGDNRERDNRFYAYHFAHNHAFSLLTTGLLGPGYVSTNYSLAIPPTLLHPGDSVNLKREPDQTLAEGSVLLYRRWQDVHVQNPCSAFSVSLNLLVGDPSLPQYSFDVAAGKVDRHVAGRDFEAGCIGTIFENLATLGDGRAR